MRYWSSLDESLNFPLPILEAALTKTPSVALLPDAFGVNGRMLMTPSPRVVIPAAVSNSGTDGAQWSQMYTPNEECQLSESSFGGVAVFAAAA